MSKPIHVDEDLHYTIKNEAADRDTSMKEFVEDLIESEMDERGIQKRAKPEEGAEEVAAD